MRWQILPIWEIDKPLIMNYANANVNLRGLRMTRQAGQDWTTSELAAEAGVDPSRIRQLLIGGEIQGYKRASTWFIPDEEAHRFLDDRRDKTTK